MFCVRLFLGVLTLVVASVVMAGEMEAPGSPEGVLYRWTDEYGGAHYTPDPGRIPASRRHTQSAVRGNPLPVAGHAVDPPAPVRAEAKPEEPAGAVAARGLTDPPPVPSVPPPAPGSDQALPGPKIAWAIQLRASPAGAEPVALPAIAVRAGEQLYRTSARIGGAPWSRVRLGFFATRSAAQTALERVASEFPGAWIIAVDPAREIGDEAASASSPPATGPNGVAPRRESAPKGYAIQLLAARAEDPTPLPTLPLPTGSRLYWSEFEGQGGRWRRLRLGD